MRAFSACPRDFGNAVSWRARSISVSAIDLMFATIAPRHAPVACLDVRV